MKMALDRLSCELKYLVLAVILIHGPVSVFRAVTM